MNTLTVFLSGAAMMASFTVSAFFFRFWKVTKDNFFRLFGLAFLLLGIERAGLIYLQSNTEARSPWIYSIRLVSFLLIILAIIHKNRNDRR